ncbi:MAG: lipid-A-disaccharide synthase [Alphaproteobacteria bacterium]
MAKSVFLIAGEPSGDALGASLMRGLKEQGLSEADISGIGGDLMKAQGLESLLPMDDICVMGLWEVAWHLPRLLRLIEGLVEEIEKRNPDVLVGIDLPDFNFQIAKRLRKRGVFKGRILHYVAPSVWAWRPGRAKDVASFLDGMMCLFPFEPQYFKPHGLKAEYVGHPLIETDKSVFQPVKFREDRGIAEDTLCVGLLLGSRERELKMHSKPFLETISALQEHYPDLELVVPSVPNLEYQIVALLDDCGVQAHVVLDQAQKWDAFAACNVALAVSGTVGLELSYAGVPHVIGYRANIVTALILKALMKTPYVHLSNILLQEEAVPEFLQWNCNVNTLTRAMMRLIRYPEQREKQVQAFARLEEALRLEGGESPSTRAAAFVLSA